jgi:hypothetical protein
MSGRSQNRSGENAKSRAVAEYSGFLEKNAVERAIIKKVVIVLNTNIEIQVTKIH